MSRATAAEARGVAVFDRFAPRPGSGYIASGYALGLIDRAVEERRPERVLEIGSGIGTITTLVLEAGDRCGRPVRQHVAVEDVAFCLEQFAENLGPRAAEVELVDRARDLDAGHGPFDLVIVDGGHTDDLLPELRHTFDAAAVEAEVAAWVPRLAPGALVVFENERTDQQAAFRRHVGRPWAYERRRPWDGTPGAHLYHLEPTVAVRLEAWARRQVDRAWHPHGLRTLRRLRARLGRPPRSVRRAVAPGG